LSGDALKLKGATKMKSQILLTNAKSLIAAVLFVVVSATASIAQTTTFTYQGRFIDGGSPANGTYDMQFKLFDNVSGGSQIGTTITNGSVAISDGVFTVQLDYGAAAFPGADRFLEIGVRPAGNIGSYTVLSPRQQLTSAVYAIRAGATTTADTATNATQLGGVPANQYVVTGDPRLTDPRPPTAGSSNYIQNTTGLQASSNFNVSGNGTAGGTLSANAVNAATQYNIGGNRMLSAVGAANTFAGLGTGLANAGDNNSFFGTVAGIANTTGLNNSFSGAFAGASNKQGNDNAFFGFNAGRANTVNDNSFFGSAAGTANTAGTENSFFGVAAGTLNTTGDSNSFFGSKAGQVNKTAANNSFFGANAGINNVSGAENSFFGEGAGRGNITGSGNAFFGLNAGGFNTSGTGNTFIGENAAPSHVFGNFNIALGDNTSVADGITNAIVIGANAAVTTSNTMMLGTSAVAVVVPGALYVKTIGTGGQAPLCTDVAGRIAGCSSSLRYKKDFQPFTRGLALLNQLKPITFKWKANDMLDLGFGAEDVAKVEPLLVTHNDTGAIEGVKYDRITAVLVNAVKEQQDQIKAQQNEIASLKRLVCRNHSRAAVCR
jgi:Chaperone of endosialidase